MKGGDDFVLGIPDNRKPARRQCRSGTSLCRLMHIVSDECGLASRQAFYFSKTQRSTSF
jgi:hypothetical protein